MALRKFSSRKVAGNLKKIRRGLRLSQEDFGKLAGNYSQDTVARWEAGQVPHALILGRISKACNVSVDSILGLDKLITAKLVLRRRGSAGREIMREVTELARMDARSLDDRGFRSYRTIMADEAWNLSLSALYASRSYEAGLAGAETLTELTERFKPRLALREYQQNLIKIGLLELHCLDCLDLCTEYLEAWNRWRARPLHLSYRPDKSKDPKIKPFIEGKTRGSLRVHFLYLTNARKRIVEKKIGFPNHYHARQDELTDEQIRERLSRIQGQEQWKL